MQRLPDAQVEVELKTRLIGVEFVRQAHFERVRIHLTDRTLTPFKERAQALYKLGVAEPQSDPQVSPYVPVARAGLPSPWNAGRYLSMGSCSRPSCGGSCWRSPGKLTGERSRTSTAGGNCERRGRARRRPIASLPAPWGEGSATEPRL